MTGSRASDLFQPGDLVNNTYRIEDILGRGGTSDVYRATSEISGRSVAIKVLKSEFAGNVDYLSLLNREEEIREIRHDAVVRYSENHRTPEGHVYLLMDYVEGPGLDDKLRDGPMSAEDLLIICRRVTSGLEAAHDRNIVHRDLSPDNIILRDNDPAQAVIIDFGIAKDTNPGAETIVGNEFAGKYAYAAPEQLAGKTDPRTDIYSLGALLLACFRGAKPDMGRNPMETLQKKGEPLDLTDVPEPLHSILARMTHPDPAQRFQNARALMAAIDAGGATAPVDHSFEDDGDRTVIVPVSARPREELAGVADQKPKVAAPAKSTSKTKVATLGVIATAIVLLAGLWFTGVVDRLMGPNYPAVSPFSLTVETPSDQPLTASGYVPSEDMKFTLTNLTDQEGGTADLTLASGDLTPGWEDDVLAMIDQVAMLDSWRIVVTDGTASVTGTTSDVALQEAVTAAGLPGNLGGSVDITFVSPFLAPAALQAALDEVADCGPLALQDPPVVGYGPTSGISVNGTVASPQTAILLAETMQVVAGTRPVTLNVETLNPTLCLIENFLPTAPTSDISVSYQYGETGDTNIDGLFYVGENPVIDVNLPADVTDGYLSISILDVSGQVFHLLPNLGRPENAVPDLRDGTEGEITVRVAFDVATAQAEGLIGFTVDNNALGKSKVIVLHSTEPLFDTLRPASESASGYAQALRDDQRSATARIISMDTRILVTAER